MSKYFPARSSTSRNFTRCRTTSRDVARCLRMSRNTLILLPFLLTITSFLASIVLQARAAESGTQPKEKRLDNGAQSAVGDKCVCTTSRHSASNGGVVHPGHEEYRFTSAPLQKVTPLRWTPIHPTPPNSPHSTSSRLNSVWGPSCSFRRI